MKTLLIVLSALLYSVLPASAHELRVHQDRVQNACDFNGNPLDDIAYCGAFSNGGVTPPSSVCQVGSSNWPTCADASTCFYFIAPTGSDSNNGTTRSTPFLTLTKAQSSMQTAGSAAQKVACLMSGSGGSYNISTPLTISTSDNGEIWQFDPNSGVNTAVLDGGNTSHIFNLNTNIQNFKINGIKMQNVSCAAIITPSNSSTGNNVIIENNDIGHVVQSGPTCAAVVINNIKNVQYKNNYIHDTSGNGLDLRAYNAGDSIDGGLITGNVILRAISGGYTDQGSIYTNMIGSKNTGGHVTISNNFIRDWGSQTVSGGNGNEEGIYLDDMSSNVTVTGNIIGPPLFLPTNNINGAFLVNDDGNASYNAANTIKNNIIDLGTSSEVFVGVIGGSNNVLSNNLILFNFTGGLHTFHNGGNTNAVYQYDSTTNTIANNGYTQFASGGSVFTNGNIISDSSPHTYTPSQLGCSGYLYTLAASSPVLAPPVALPVPAGGWGPPGFVIPTSTNHSCP